MRKERTIFERTLAMFIALAIIVTTCIVTTIPTMAASEISVSVNDTGTAATVTVYPLGETLYVTTSVGVKMKNEADGYESVDVTDFSLIDDGTVLSFTVTENGDYQVSYMGDEGAYIEEFTVTGIDETAPEFYDSDWDSTTGKITVSVEDAYLDTVTVSCEALGITDYELSCTQDPHSTTHYYATYEPTKNGSYVFTATDYNGNTATHTVTVSTFDEIAPTITVERSPASTSDLTNQVIIYLTVDDASVIDEVLFDGTALNEVANNPGLYTVTVTSNGTYDYSATDEYGNKTESSLTVSNIDNVAPVVTEVTTTAVVDGDSATITIEGTVSELKEMGSEDEGSGLDTVKYLVGTDVTSTTDTAWDTASSATLNDESFKITGLTENGTYTFLLIDKAGNMDLASYVVNVDISKPTVTTNYSTDWTQSLDISLTVADDSDVTVVFDGGELTEDEDTPGLYIATVTKNDTYTYTVTDENGNKTTGSVVITNIDTTAPTFEDIDIYYTTGYVGTQTIGGHAGDNSDSFTLYYCYDADAALEADNTAWDTASTLTVSEDSFSLKDITENGFYTFKLVDAAGNSAITSVEITNIDNTAPTVTLTYDGAALTEFKYLDLDEGEFTITITDDEAGFDADSIETTFAQSGGATYTVLSSDYTDGVYTRTSSLASGSYTLTVVVDDAVGNQATVTYEFVNDTIDPDVSASVDGTDLSTTKTTYFTSSMETLSVVISDTYYDLDNTTVTLSKDGGDPEDITCNWSLYTGTFDVTTLIEGSYELTVNGADKAGHVTEEVYTYVYDETAPTISATYGDDALSDTRVYFDEVQTVTITVDDVNFDPDTTTIKVTKDENEEAFYEGEVTWVQVSDTVWTYTATYDEDADYDIRVSGYDLAGNYSEKTFSFCIDTTAPTIGATANGQTLSDEVTYFDATTAVELVITEKNYDDSNTTITATKDGESFNLPTPSETTDDENFSLTKTYVLDDPEDGEYVITATHTDKSGRTTTETFVFTLDTLAPDFTASYDSEVVDDKTTYFDYQGELILSLTEINFDSDDTDSTVVTATLDGVSYDVDCVWEEVTDGFEGTLDFSKAADGLYKVNVKITDLAGNVTSEDYEFVIDTVDPVIDIAYNATAIDDAATIYFNADGDLTIIITDNYWDDATVVILQDGVDMNIDSDNLVWYLANSNEWTTTIALTADADYEISVETTDLSGNVADAEALATLDQTIPVVGITYTGTPFQGNNFNTDRTATIVVEEHNFDADGFVYTVNGVDVSDTLSWAQVGDVYTATYDFTDDDDYVIGEVSMTDLADNANDGIDYNDSYSVSTFTIDRVNPTGKVAIDENFWETFLSTITFGLWSSDTVNVVLTADDNSSGVYEIAYFTVPDALTYDEVIAVTDWSTSSNTVKFSVDPDTRFIVYTRVTDNAGNITYLSSDGMIVDSTLPTEDLEPEISLNPEQPVNDIYNATDEVNVAVSVTDPTVGVDEVYSGLATITYTVTSLGVETQTKTFDFTDDTSLLQSYDFDIAVDATLNNSNDVTVTVTAVDNAGNSSTSSVDLQIDNTAPVISVTYDNNDEDDTLAGYFNADRTATIVITERNFDPTQTVVTIENTNGTSVPTISDWTEVVSDGNGDASTYTATVTFSADGDYTFAISTVDLAGNANDQTDAQIYGSSVAPTAFTIDQTDSFSTSTDEVVDDEAEDTDGVDTGDSTTTLPIAFGVLAMTGMVVLFKKRGLVK